MATDMEESVSLKNKTIFIPLYYPLPHPKEVMIYDATFHSCASKILCRLCLIYFQFLFGIEIRRKVGQSGTVLQGSRREVEKHAFHFKCN